MIKVECKTIYNHVDFLIDSGEIRCYNDPKILDRLHLEKINIENVILVQLTTEIKRRINEMVRG
jgi:hypothetical protein